MITESHRDNEKEVEKDGELKMLKPTNTPSWLAVKSDRIVIDALDLNARAIDDPPEPVASPNSSFMATPVPQDMPHPAVVFQTHATDALPLPSAYSVNTVSSPNANSNDHDKEKEEMHGDMAMSAPPPTSINLRPSSLRAENGTHPSGTKSHPNSPRVRFSPRSTSEHDSLEKDASPMILDESVLSGSEADDGNRNGNENDNGRDKQDEGEEEEDELEEEFDDDDNKNKGNGNANEKEEEDDDDDDNDNDNDNENNN
ncbi:hypothetical protein RFI_06180 [Reticulomyxa filosa]|uniref:Uncharacterized protein n=1 Tax=Reticulomyxa filosa TaxID=46433 RepID=X6NXB2_RETFI|nr:hypothetical protein RFI_06180 [Reticulomyxa filosa]|eukprot:ETO30940.1 hypothetical protein RFI_06180 [Reticulomyxa filosa]